MQIPVSVLSAAAALNSGVGACIVDDGGECHVLAGWLGSEADDIDFIAIFPGYCYEIDDDGKGITLNGAAEMLDWRMRKSSNGWEWHKREDVGLVFGVAYH